jgi:hypothetical protein
MSGTCLQLQLIITAHRLSYFERRLSSESLTNLGLISRLFSNLLPGNDSFTVISSCNGNVISNPLLTNGRLLRLHHSGFQPSCHNIVPPITHCVASLIHI